MKKTIMASLIVCILAIGTVGYAFATGLDFNNGVGALSTGTANVTDANVTGIFWGLENNFGGEPYINNVRLQFDKDLAKGTVIGLSLYNKAGNIIVASDKVNSNGARLLPEAVVAGGDVRVYFGNVNPADVYDIRVTVAEPRPFK